MLYGGALWDFERLQIALFSFIVANFAADIMTNLRTETNTLMQLDKFYTFVNRIKILFMKRKTLIFLFLIMSLVCAAQEGRTVSGVVRGETHGPISGAVVSAVELNLFTRTDTLGRFEINLPDSVTQLQITAAGYYTLDRMIDTQFLVCNMKLDPGYAVRASEIVSVEARLAREAEQRMIQAELERVKAEKRAERLEKDDRYNAQYKNIGFVHSLEFAYGYQLAQGDVIYKNLGYREFGNLHPIELSYTLTYRFHYLISLGIGAGVQYQCNNLCNYSDIFEPSYSDYEDFTPINVPLFLNTKLYLTRGKCQPVISLSGGVYLPNYEGLFDVGIGANLRLSRLANMYFLFSCRTTPYFDFREYPATDTRPAIFAYYPKSAWTPTLKIGFTL